MLQQKYRDRLQAGRQLANLLSHCSSDEKIILLALPRGGIPVAYPIAKKLRTPIYPFIVRKLGVPGYSELAMGAIAVNHTVIFNQSVLKDMRISDDEIQQVIQIETNELARREKEYLADRQLPSFKNHNIILVDDGIATGATIKAAISAIKIMEPSRIIVAVPVCPDNMVDELNELVDDFVCPLNPANFNAVGEWYHSFPAVDDETVKNFVEECYVAFKQIVEE